MPEVVIFGGPMDGHRIDVDGGRSSFSMPVWDGPFSWYEAQFEIVRGLPVAIPAGLADKARNELLANLFERLANLSRSLGNRPPGDVPGHRLVAADMLEEASDPLCEFLRNPAADRMLHQWRELIDVVDQLVRISYRGIISQKDADLQRRVFDLLDDWRRNEDPTGVARGLG